MGQLYTLLLLGYFLYTIYMLYFCVPHSLTHTHTHTRKLKPTHRYIRRRHNDPTDTLTNSTAYYTIMIVLAFCILETNERTNRNKQEGKKRSSGSETTTATMSTTTKHKTQQLTKQQQQQSQFYTRFSILQIIRLTFVVAYGSFWELQRFSLKSFPEKEKKAPHNTY